MPKIEDHFQKTPLYWHRLSGGTKYNPNSYSSIDLDGTRNATGQAISKVFTLGSLPEGAGDDKWDTVQFEFLYQHVNWAAKSPLADHGYLGAWITDENHKVVDSNLFHRQVVGHENASAGRHAGVFSANFYNLAPGRYRLNVGEMTKGDGEPLRVEIYSGKSVEAVPDTPPPPAEAEENSLNTLETDAASQGSGILQPEKILSRGRREVLGDPPPAPQEKTITPEENETGSNTIETDPALLGSGTPQPEKILSRGRRGVLGDPPPAPQEKETKPEDDEILSSEERDLNRNLSPLRRLTSRLGRGRGTRRGSRPIPCFTSGTMIETPRGLVPVDALVKGSIVRTCTRGWQMIRWIGSRKLSAEDLAREPNIRPIRIKAGALGTGTPIMDLVVSPQHRILVRSKPALRMFGVSEILVAAKHLLEIDGIDVASDMNGVEYFHFMFDQHEIVMANGAATESFYTGDEALKSVDEAVRHEITQIFPQLKEGNPMTPAIPFATGSRARQLVRRHIKNQLGLVS